MGKKRKQERTEEEIRRKIKKLERKLAKPRFHPPIISPPLEISVDNVQEDTPVELPEDWARYWLENYESHDASKHNAPPETSPPHGSSPHGSPPHGSPPHGLPPHGSPPHGSPPHGSPPHGSLPHGSPPPGSPPRGPPPPPEIPVDTETELELDTETLELLGDAPKSDTKLGSAIHEDIAARWQEILAKGLPKETKTKIMSDYLIPSNCERMVAPLLNPEAKAALPEPAVKRDSSIMAKQNQLGVALSALAMVTELVVSNEISKQKILKPLSDACRLLCDSHHAETKTRRNFVLGSINAGLRETLNEAGSEKFLFGENVGEKWKIAKNIQRSGEALKTQTNKQTASKNFSTQKNRPNFRAANQRKPPPQRNVREPIRAAHAPPQRAPPRANMARRSSPPARRPYRK